MDEPFIEQITAFPNAANDDMADVVTQASAWLLQANWPTVTIRTVIFDDSDHDQ